MGNGTDGRPPHLYRRIYLTEAGSRRPGAALKDPKPPVRPQPVALALQRVGALEDLDRRIRRVAHVNAGAVDAVPRRAGAVATRLVACNPPSTISKLAIPNR